MANTRSEYDDKNLRKNAMSGRRLKIELDRIDNVKDQLTRHYRHEEDMLRKELKEDGEFSRFPTMDSHDLQAPLSLCDRKTLTPRFARRQSGIQLNSSFPPISTTSDARFLQGRRSSMDKRRSSPSPTNPLQECITIPIGAEDRRRSKETLVVPKLLARRGSENNALEHGNNIEGRINEFYRKVSKSVENVSYLPLK